MSWLSAILAIAKAIPTLLEIFKLWRGGPAKQVRKARDDFRKKYNEERQKMRDKMRKRHGK